MFAQIIAIVIFLGMFLLIILDKFERHYVTLCSGILVLTIVFGVCMHSFRAVWETLNLGAFFERSFWYGAGEEATTGINWSTILFIAGMMIMVEGLGKAGSFRWLCLSLAKLVHYRIVPLLICFMTLSAILSMFIDSITVVLFMLPQGIWACPAGKQWSGSLSCPGCGDYKQAVIFCKCRCVSAGGGFADYTCTD